MSTNEAIARSVGFCKVCRKSSILRENGYCLLCEPSRSEQPQGWQVNHHELISPIGHSYFIEDDHQTGEHPSKRLKDEINAALKAVEASDLFYRKEYERLQRELAAERERSVDILREKALEFAEQSGGQIQRIKALVEALEKIKKQVCGEKIPNWDSDWHITATRRWIADICDAALAKDK